MAINTKDVLDMSPAFFAELQDVAVTEKGLSNWASLASSVNSLKKEARVLKPIAKSPVLAYLKGTGKGAPLLQPISKSPTLKYLKTNPISRLLTSNTASAVGGSLKRTLDARGIAGRIAKAEQKGLPPLALLSGQEAKAVRASLGKVDKGKLSKVEAAVLNYGRQAK